MFVCVFLFGGLGVKRRTCLCVCSCALVCLCVSLNLCICCNEIKFERCDVFFECRFYF